MSDQTPEHLLGPVIWSIKIYWTHNEGHPSWRALTEPTKECFRAMIPESVKPGQTVTFTIPLPEGALSYLPDKENPGIHKMRFEGKET